MTTVTSFNWLLIAFCTLTEAGRELCFKQAADKVSVSQALRRPILWLGIALWIIELAAWLRVLETVPLTIAYPLMALVYVIIQIGGVVLLKEPFTKRHGWGALLITVGVGCIGSTGI